MQVLIIGGSGRTGKDVIEESLNRNHKVTALVRNAGSLQKRQGLTIVEGTPLNRSDIGKAWNAGDSRPDVAIVTLASVRASDSLFAAQVSPPRMMTDSAMNLVNVMKEMNLPKGKVVILSAAGVGASWSQLPLAIRFLLGHSNVKYGYDDHNLLEKEVKESGINYVLAKPTRLVDGQALPIQFYDGNRGVGLAASTSRKSVAQFLVEALEKNEWDGSMPVFSN